MSVKQNKVKVMSSKLDKSAIVLAESFVDFKRRAASALSMSGWLNVRVVKASDFELGPFSSLQIEAVAFKSYSESIFALRMLSDFDNRTSLNV